LVTLQAEYADWLAALPDSLQGSATADALEAIVGVGNCPPTTAALVVQWCP
jgi:hypothetical protein